MEVNLKSFVQYFGFLKVSKCPKKLKDKRFASPVKECLHIPFTNAFTALSCIFYHLPWFVDVYGKKVITLKTQRNAENECRNRMWQLGFNLRLQ